MLVGSRCLFRRCAASSSSATAPSANIFFPIALPGSSISATVQPLATVPPLATARPLATTSPLVAAPRPATNLIRQRSTPVWLAIWRTWTGFANSQLRCANFPALIYIYASIPIAATLKPLLRHSKSFGPSAPIAYATSVSPPDEAVA